MPSPATPTRKQLATIFGSDKYLLKAFESLFESKGVSESKLQNVEFATELVTTPANDTDEVWVITTDGDRFIDLPTGIQGKKYRIINIGQAGNTAFINPRLGDLLLGSTEQEYLEDGEVVIITYEAPEGWY